jgi:hypothetical protein
MTSPSRRSSTRAALPAASSAAPPRPGRTQVTIPNAHWYRPPPNPEFGGSGTLTALASPRATATFSGSGVLASVGAPAATALLNGTGTLAAPGAPAAFTDFTGDGALSVVAAGSSAAAFTSDAALTATGIPAPTAPFTADGAAVGDAVPVTSVAFTGEGTFVAAEEQHYLAFLEGEGSLTVTAAPTATASFSGAGALASAISPAAVAALSGSGTLAASGVASGAAGFSGSGELIVPTTAAEAALSGDGALSVLASPAVPVALSGAGSLAASGVPILTAAHSGAGTLAASGAGVGTAALSGSGTLEATGYGLFTDDFNRANNTSIGSQWTETGGDLTITSNMLAVNSAASSTNNRRGAVYNFQTQTPYQTVEFTAGTAPNGTATAGAILRCNSAMTEMFILATYNGGWNFGRITGINGTYSPVGSQSVTIASGAVVRVQCDANSVWSVYINGTKSGLSYRDTTWADSSHQYLGVFVQRVSGVNSHSLDNFKAWDTRALTQIISDDFNRVSLGSSWTQASQNGGGGALYLSGNELSAVGLLSSPICVAYHNTVLPGDNQVVKARLRWNSRVPEHSSMSVGLRANPGVHHGVHFWCTSNLMGICIYSLDLTSFTAATGTADYVSTSQFAEGAMMELRAEGTVYTALVDSVPVLQGTFTTGVVPLTNHYACIHGEDDSAVSGGGQPPGNLDDFAAYVIL